MPLLITSLVAPRVPCNFVADPSCVQELQTPLQSQPCASEHHGLSISQLQLGPLNDDFPYRCVPGFVGNQWNFTDQSGPQCSGACVRATPHQRLASHQSTLLSVCMGCVLHAAFRLLLSRWDNPTRNLSQRHILHGRQPVTHIVRRGYIWRRARAYESGAV
jgi:hypothetical protein